MSDTTLLDALHRGSYRLTRPRERVAALIGSRRGHFTASDLMDAARKQGSRVGRATIFRALDTFVELGVVERIDLPSGEHAYVVCEPELSHHHHVVCTSCGRSTEVPGCNIADIAAEASTRTGYRVDTHRIELYGLCPTCAAGA
jgi:Fur family ferric uptake transcriptional regulator